MASKRINFLADPLVKKRAAAVFDRLGLDLSTGLNIYLHQVALTGKIPFSVELPESGRKRRK